MRKFLRNMARAKMKRMGYSNVNLKMRGHWREIIGAYPVNIITGQQMALLKEQRQSDKD